MPDMHHVQQMENAQNISPKLSYQRHTVMKKGTLIIVEGIIRELTKAISEASLCALGPQLEEIFITMLLFCDLSRPLKLWEKTLQIISEDILHKKAKNGDWVCACLVRGGGALLSRGFEGFAGENEGERGQSSIGGKRIHSAQAQCFKHVTGIKVLTIYNFGPWG
nr:hypothetical protein CTI12_AA591910 [Tanacetum cinerariifolium]